MRHFAVPIVVVSKCLGFAACRYDGDVVRDGFVQRLGTYCRLLPVCPEVEIGLGTPRPPIRIVDRGTRRLIQPSSGRDLTALMEGFADEFLESLDAVDGFILKSSSPSGGIGDTKIFPDVETEAHTALGDGVFAAAVKARHAGAAIEDEARLADLDIRRRFLTLLFARAARRETGDSAPGGAVPSELMDAE